MTHPVHRNRTAEIDFRGETRPNATHASTTAPDARRFKTSAGTGTRHAGCALSQKRRKKIGEPFGWAKTIGGMAQTVLRGIEGVRARFTLTMVACNRV